MTVKYLNLVLSQDEFDALLALKKASGLSWEQFVLACAKAFKEAKA